MHGFSQKQFRRILRAVLLEQLKSGASLASFQPRAFFRELLLACLRGDATEKALTPKDAPCNPLLGHIFTLLQNRFAAIGAADGKTTIFQFARFPLPALWKSGADAQAYQIANAVPKGIGGFYEPGNTLDEAYFTLLRTLRPVEAENTPRYRALEAHIKACTQEELAVRKATLQEYQAWQALCGQSPPPFQIWLADPFGGLCQQEELERLRKKHLSFEAEQQALASQLNQALQSAQKRIDPPYLDTMYISSNGMPRVAVPKVVIAGNLAQDRARWLGAPPALDIRVSAEDLAAECLADDADTALMAGMRACSASKRSTGRSFALRLSAVGLGVYPIARGHWFSAEFVRPGLPLLEHSHLNEDDFFGASGCLHAIPTSLLVLYRPTLEIQCASAEELREFYPKDAGAPDWFGFKLQAPNKTNASPQLPSGEGFAMRFESDEDTPPQVIGVVSSLAYNGR